MIKLLMLILLQVAVIGQGLYTLGFKNPSDLASVLGMILAIIVLLKCPWISVKDIE